MHNIFFYSFIIFNDSFICCIVNKYIMLLGVDHRAESCKMVHDALCMKWKTKPSLIPFFFPCTCPFAIPLLLFHNTTQSLYSNQKTCLYKLLFVFSSFCLFKPPCTDYAHPNMVHTPLLEKHVQSAVSKCPRSCIYLLSTHLASHWMSQQVSCQLHVILIYKNDPMLKLQAVTRIKKEISMVTHVDCPTYIALITNWNVPTQERALSGTSFLT